MEYTYEKTNEGNKMYEFAKRIFPYTRSLTGEGVRQTLEEIKNYINDDEECSVDFKVKSIKSGSAVFDWIIPKEWYVREAYIEDELGNRIIDMNDNNLHVLGYSTPVDEWMELDELLNHVYTQPDQPDWIPYVTSYYKERYGFCMSENMKNSLKEGKYHAYIDSRLFDGVLNYAEIILPGKEETEVLFSTYICHPSMANNECSGPALSAQLVKYLTTLSARRYTYRFIFIPETIGAIAYLCQDNNLDNMKKNLIAGFNLSCVGDDRDYSIIESKYGDTLADRVLKNILKNKCHDSYSTYKFKESGSDERRYNSAHVNLPVVGFCRSKYGVYPEYHTSADDMNLVSPAGFQGSFDVMRQVINALEYNKKYVTKFICEPQLGPRGLYTDISQKGSATDLQTMMMLIYYSDGISDLIDISNILEVSMEELIEIVIKLVNAGIIE